MIREKLLTVLKVKMKNVLDLNCKLAGKLGFYCNLTHEIRLIRRFLSFTFSFLEKTFSKIILKNFGTFLTWLTETCFDKIFVPFNRFQNFKR